MTAVPKVPFDPSHIASLLPTKLPHVTCTATVTDAVMMSLTTASGRKAVVHPPGLAVASFFPEITAVLKRATDKEGASKKLLYARVLAYLRAVRGGVLLSTIVARIAEPVGDELAAKRVADAVAFLLETEAIRREEGLYFIAWGWRHILPDVLTIDTVAPTSTQSADTEEQKVAARRLVRQAANHRRFAHHAFVALPGPLAEGLRGLAVFRDRGVGLLKIAPDNSVSVIINSQKQLPLSWLAYYRIALSLPVETINAWTYPEPFSTT